MKCRIHTIIEADYNQEENMRLEVVDTELCVGCQSCMFACSRRSGEGGLAHSCIQIKSAGGMERGFVAIVCRACDDPPCIRACPVDAISVRKSGGVKVSLDICIGCENCVEACIVGAVQWDSERNKPMICIHCGVCVDYCPHGVLSLKEKRGVYHAVK